jgi:hypothetical protein
VLGQLGGVRERSPSPRTCVRLLHLSDLNFPDKWDKEDELFLGPFHPTTPVLAPLRERDRCLRSWPVDPLAFPPEGQAAGGRRPSLVQENGRIFHPAFDAPDPLN